MKKDSYTLPQLVIIALAAILFGVLVGGVVANAQQLTSKTRAVRHISQHDDQVEFCDEGRFVFPVKVTSVEGETVYFVIEGRRTMEARSLVIDQDTQFPAVSRGDFLKKYDQGYWMIFYCDEHKVAYQIIPSPPPKRRDAP